MCVFEIEHEHKILEILISCEAVVLGIKETFSQFGHSVIFS